MNWKLPALVGAGLIIFASLFQACQTPAAAPALVTEGPRWQVVSTDSLAWGVTVRTVRARNGQCIALFNDNPVLVGDSLCR